MDPWIPDVEMCWIYNLNRRQTEFDLLNNSLSRKMWVESERKNTLSKIWWSNLSEALENTFI